MVILSYIIQYHTKESAPTIVERHITLGISGPDLVDFVPGVNKCQRDEFVKMNEILLVFLQLYHPPSILLLLSQANGDTMLGGLL